MIGLRELAMRLRSFVRRSVAERDLEEEFRFHLQMETEKNLRAGMSPEEARRNAIIAFGGVERHKEEVREGRSMSWLDEIRHDLAHAVRVAAKRPAFSLAVILTLALGIGATTAVFSLINGIVLRPLPYVRPDRLYLLFEQDSLGTRQVPSYPAFLDWHQQSDAFDGLAYVRGATLAYQTAEHSGLVIGAFVSEGFFHMLGIPAQLGRTLGPDEYLPANSHVAVLSHQLWTTTFGGDSAVIGRVARFGNATFTIVGVMPPTFTYPQWGLIGTELWLPIPALPPPDMAALRQRGFHADSWVIARLKPGTGLTGAEAQMAAVARRLAAAYPESNGRWTRVSFNSLTEFVVGDVRARLFMLGAAVAVVLLICCVNLGNLYLAQGAARRHEFAIRAALGAGWRRVVRQLLTESLVVAAVGGALGALLAFWCIELVRVRASELLPRVNELRSGLGVLGLAIALTTMTAVLFALLAAKRAASPHLSQSLTERRSMGLDHGGRGRLPTWLLSAQVALTVALLIVAGLLTKTLWRLSQVVPGFDPSRLISIRIEPPSPQYDEADAAVGLYRRLAESLAAVPGIERVALVNHAPVGRGGVPSAAAIGHAPTGSSDDIRVLFLTVSAGFFSTMGIPVLAGREFTGADVNGPPGPLVVNEVLAKRWGERTPVGQRLGVLRAARTRPDFGQPLVGTVVGVVGNVKQFGLDTDPVPTVYVPYSHNPWASMTLLARTAARPEALVAAVENAVRLVDPAIPLEGRALGAGVVGVKGSYGSQALNAGLIGGFAAVALLLAAIGIYGVTSYTVTLETREIGIRMAVGASAAAVLGGVIGRMARVTAVGLIAGTAAAVGLTRFLVGLLYQVRPTDPATFVGVGVLLAFVAALAAYLPARRAAAVDPVIALRF